MQNKQAILEPDGMYHIYNRANGSESLFVSDENYRFFLQQYKKYIEPIAVTWCYCLMPNHFRFLVRINSKVELEATFPKFQTLEEFKIESNLSKQFSNLFSSYTQAFNKMNDRKGSLFMKNFKRKAITDSKYLIKLIHYIHYNPIEAGFCTKPGDWKYSSYSAIVANKRTNINRNEVIELFEDLGNFKYCHQVPSKHSGIDD